MSGPDLREHSYVKVLYDFQYKTTEGREIAIKKNERLYLLQKTNADWWQVVRTWEQTSFYVPATYVREMSKSGGNQKKTSDEDKDVAFESLDGPKYKNMPKETSSAMKNVKKWLAGAMDSKQESPASSTIASSSSLSKSLYITDESHKHNAMDYQSRAELKVGLAAIKAKSLERDRERRSTYERQKSEQPVEITKFKKRPNETPKKLPNTMGIKDIDLDLLSSSPSSSYKLTKSFSTSPKSFDAPAARIEIPLPDPFRQELKSSLDRRRKISDNTDYDKLVQENRNHELNRQSRIRTKSSHSDDSQLESDNDERFLSRVDENPKRLDKPESKLSVSLREDSGTQSGRQSPSVSNRNSRSLDLDSKQFSLRTERSLSPKLNYGRQLTVAGQIADEEADANNAISDCKILNDKRRTWAVEELMSELTQMCRERVNNKKPPNFQLKSTEIKGNFDPLDELTRELHEMNLQRSEESTPQAETRSEFKSNDGSPSNVCKISINSTSGSRTHDLNSINTTVVIDRDDDELEDITEHSNISEASDLSDSSLAFRYPKVEKSTFTFRTGEVLPQSKPLKSPKSPKIDEYNEANILNDCSPDDKFDNRSLSLDKQSHYLKSATVTTTTTTTATTTANDTNHSSPDNDHESSGYSNFKMRHTGKVKMRPKAKVKSDAGSETHGELKLTPSLEKLASEIQFLPAKKTTNVNHHTSNHNHNHSHSDSHSHSHSHNHNRNRNNDNSNNKIYKNTSSLNESMSDGDAYDDSGIHDETYRSEDSGSGRRNIIYSNSFKTKREGRYFHRHEFTDDDDDEDEDDDDNDDDDEEDDDGIISAARKCNLKKSSTLHCATIPENYRRFRISNDFAAILARSKRRSRSLSDLNSFDDEEDVMENVTYPQNSPKIKPVPLPRTKIPAIKSEDELSTRGEEMETVAPLPRKITTKKDYPEVWVNSKQVPGYGGQIPEVDIESSTAVGFKSLLCTSDSGSDNCLQSKELVNNDSNERHDSCNYSSHFKNRGLEKSSSRANLRKDGAKVRESPSDEQILSSNASSEALQSQSESEFTGGLDASLQPSPVSIRVAPECYECAIDLPPGWTQKYDPHTDQICFINEQGDKITEISELSLLQESCKKNFSISSLRNSDRTNTRGPSVLSLMPLTTTTTNMCILQQRLVSTAHPQSKTFDSDNTRDVDVDVDDESSNYDEEINIQECELNPKGNPENELVGTSPCTRVGEEHNKENDINITNEEVGFSCCLDDVADSDSENVDNSSYMSEFMPDGQFPDTSSHSWSFSELTMYPRRVVCCVDLIRDESGYFTSCQTNSFENLPEPKLVMEHDDTDALMVCQKFLNETTSVDRSRNDSSGSMSTIPGSYDIGSYEASYHFVEENTDLHTSGSNTTSEPIVMNCENNLSLSNVNVKVNVTFPSDVDAAAAGNVRWTQTFNNFDSHDSRNSKSINNNNNNNNNVIYDYDCKFVSNEQLYKSCDNLDTDNTRLSKIEDSIGSGSSYLQELSREVDEEVEECTSFDDKYSQAVIYENWNTCLTSECSSQSLDDTRTSEFYSPIEFNETAFDEAAGINNFCDYDDDDDDNYSGIDKFRQRKGSTSSDILMWKKNLLLFNMDDEDDMRQWFSSNDDEGKIYFFEENSNESSWVLPTVTASKSQINAPAHKEEKPIEEDSNATNEFSQPENSLAGTPYINQNSSNNDAVSVSGSKKPGLSDWPQLSFDGNMIILKEGLISRTKITENGKKLRKNWNTSYAVLTELFLLFFKDSKTFNTMMKSGQSPIAKPDISVDLNGAIIEPGERASSRKNVYMISTVLGLQVLIQSDNTALAAEWFQEIHGAIRKLPFSFKSQAKPFAGPPEVRKISNSKLSADQSEESKKSSKVARSRSMKTVKRLDDSLEDLSGTVAERQTKIKAKLRRFFQRRPPVESLVKNGIYKNEPAFGSYLKDVCPTEHPRVPLFVKTCIEVLESNEDNMKTDGLYRASGNLSQIQKIRLQVDQYNLSVLSQEEDVHVLTGALKLFFRELKEPLIPSSFFKEALNASMLKKTSAKIQCFRDIVKALPPSNYDTLQFLLKHLLKVTSYQEFNRMHIPNLAIVFGPTLMWPAEESANMALDLMQQNLVIECLLSEYNKIFK